jgi:hypothetical protein
VRVLRVDAPSGRTYGVGVKPVRHARPLSEGFHEWFMEKTKDRKDHDSTLLDSLGTVEDPVGALFPVVAVVGFVEFIRELPEMLGIGLYYLLLGVDYTANATVFVSAVVARAGLRRPWTVVARRTDRGERDSQPESRVIQVVGLRRACRMRDSVAKALADGTDLHSPGLVSGGR